MCYKIIKSTKETEIFQLIEDTNNTINPKQILDYIHREINGNRVTISDLDQILSWISRSRNKIKQDKPLDFEPQVRNFTKIYNAYEAYKKAHNYMDYDDLIFKTAEILTKNNRIKEFWNQKFDYIQVDEGQDLSMVQFQIIKLICANANVFVVADDDQSIYGFRGADPSCILQIENYYPTCVKYYLERNYRSEKTIVDLSCKIVENNTIRYVKKLYSEKNGTGKILFRHFSKGFYQSKYICEEIVSGKCGSEIGILYRNNISALIIAVLLCKIGHPFKIAGGSKNLVTHWMITDFLKSLNSLYNDLRIFFVTKNLEYIYNKISKAGFFENCYTYCENSGQDGRIVNGLSEFLFAICHISFDNAEALSLLSQMKSAFESGVYDGWTSGSVHNTKSIITLTTIHSAKGLEYETVFLIDLMKDEFPGHLLEEERRLFYVGITRAKKNLYFTYPESRGGKRENASVFYCEALDEWKKMKVKRRI